MLQRTNTSLFAAIDILEKVKYRQLMDALSASGMDQVSGVSTTDTGPFGPAFDRDNYRTPSMQKWRAGLRSPSAFHSTHSSTAVRGATLANAVFETDGQANPAAACFRRSTNCKKVAKVVIWPIRKYPSRSCGRPKQRFLLEKSPVPEMPRRQTECVTKLDFLTPPSDRIMSICPEPNKARYPPPYRRWIRNQAAAPSAGTSPLHSSGIRNTMMIALKNHGRMMALVGVATLHDIEHCIPIRRPLNAR